jgi:hypothetical protein
MRRALILAVAGALLALAGVPAQGAVSSAAEDRIDNPEADPTYGDYLANFGAGATLDAEGIRVAAGASGYGPQPGQGANKDRIGRVYLFRCGRAAGCLPEATLSPSDGTANLYFGWSVAVSGTTVVVGTWNRGKAYVYTKAGTAWQETILAAPAGSSTHFGNRVDIDGDRIVIGDDEAEGLDGAVYVFERAAGVWSHAATLTFADPTHAGFLGTDVAVQGDTIVAGQVGSNAVVIFTKGAGAAWSSQKVLSPDGDSGFQIFGRAVAVDRDYIYVGAQGSELFVLKKTGSSWSFLERETPSPAPGGSFGNDLSAAAGRVLVADPPAAVYLGQRSFGQWRWERIVATDLVADEYFGGGVALAEERAVAGAPLKSFKFGIPSRIYVYQLCAGRTITVRGTDGPDDLTGTAGSDVAYLFGRRDRFSGMGGDDFVCGGGANDVLMGGAGNDTLIGGRDVDTAKGGAGNDTCKAENVEDCES